jgi:hypothetical protein
MTWVATDDFDSYTIGASLSGASGGSGWTGNWTIVSGAWTAQAAPAGGQGGNAARATPGNQRLSRTFTGVLTEVVKWRMLCTVTNPDAFTGVILFSGGAGLMSITFGADGNLKIYDNTLTYTTLQAYSANTWYTITVDFVEATDKYRAKIDAGAYSAFYDGDNTWDGASPVNLIELRSQSTNATFWFDDVGPEPATPPISNQPETLHVIRSGIRLR